MWTHCGYFKRLVDLRFLKNALEGVSVREKYSSISSGFEAIAPQMVDMQWFNRDLIKEASVTLMSVIRSTNNTNSVVRVKGLEPP